MNMSVDSGVVGLLANANKRSSFTGNKLFFKGDLNQMYQAQSAADRLGIETDIDGGIPFVMSEKDYEKVTQHIIANKIEGWWHYVSREEYHKIKGE